MHVCRSHLRKRKRHSLDNGVALRADPEENLVVIVEHHGLVVPQVSLHKIKDLAHTQRLPQQ